MSLAPITLDTELRTIGDTYEMEFGTLPEGSTGQVLKVEPTRVLVEWTYVLSDVPWASEYHVTEWLDLDDWAALTLLGFEEPEEA